MTNWSVSLLRNPYLIFVGWTLSLALCETTAVAVLFAIVRASAPRRPVSRDYMVALGAFGLAIAAIPLTVAWQIWGTAQISTSIATGQILPAASANTGAALRTFLQRPALDTIAAVVAVAWIVGVCGLLARLMGGWWLMRSVVAQSRPIDDEQIRGATDLLRARAGVNRPVSLVASSIIEAPVVVGWRTPRVVIPIGALPRLSRGEMSAVLAHEFAHIRRRDYAINLLQSVAEVPLFFSPAIAWLARCIREAREFCCDDEAVASVGDRRHYVEALISLANVQTVNEVQPGVGIAGPRLVTRVRRLLQEKSMPRLSPVRIISLAGVLGLIAVTGVQVSAVSALRVPRQSDSTVYKITDPGLTAPVAVHMVKPTYTDEAKKRKVTGNVELDEVITADGAVRDDVRVTKSLDPGLDAEAVKAAKQWQFRPATKDGKPVNVMVHMEMTFTLK